MGRYRCGSEDLVVDALVVDEVVEELVHGFGSGLWDHMTGSFHSDHCKIVVVELVEAGVLISYVPRVPLAYLIPPHLVHVHLGISEGHDIVPIPTEQPYLHGPIVQDALVLCH